MTTLKRLITQTWNPTLHPYPPLSKKRFGKPLVNLLPSILSHTDPSWDHERVSTSPVQPHIDIRWVVVPSLRVHWSHLHILEWCISFPLDHSKLWGTWWIFDVGGWRRESFLIKLMVLWITGYVLFLTLCHAYIVKYLMIPNKYNTLKIMLTHFNCGSVLNQPQ